MTRTCPYCGTKIKHKTAFFPLQKVECPTCGNDPFHPVLKQLRTANISILLTVLILFMLDGFTLVLEAKLPHWSRILLVCRLVISIFLAIALLLVPILQHCLTRDCYVQKMYEKEQNSWGNP